ncbi:hypothetical protein KL918_003978 [Ogataea parapolymorpha]|uniref:D-galactonate transporter n=1 Tax=Ogataea parapolymorpha (strain ATCC 26012 / BCRC 20466 / JCM 22074 / NRRL Y-7560 / DL-1) TaxID=871575 RepID=W1QEE6_OGAPD|nr:D-galactonate transporter [Ogataea parapolymorpha DL-1]ESW98278.1 D-galactonate transporter [Ogataea parapolymorpha DL-1]KAG7865989.1 hypothetical protein KL918_003978 [Ogataea parapolymorpha]KAG7874857.1 hypothetical protein KL916_001101 [Ogataea parapolymorpha]
MKESKEDEKHIGIIEVTSHTPEDFVDFTEEEEKKVVRKIDMYVLPVMCLVFFAQYLDKQSLAYAVIVGLREDLHLNGPQYSWCTSGFYLAQLASQIVYMYLLSKFPTKMVTGICVIIWAAVCMCLAAPATFAGFVTVRAFLGFFEGCVSPAFVIVTSSYYKKSEHGLRTAAWISCNAITQVLATYLFYGLAKGENNLSMAVWRVGFLVCGAFTLVVGLLFYFMVPLSPKEAWFLTEREKTIAVHRLLAEADRGEKKSWDWDQAKECLTDWVAWSSFLFGLITTMCSCPIGFSTIIINGFGYDKFKTMEYSSPSGAVQFVMIWIGVAMIKIAPRQRCIIICLLILVPLAGNIMLFKMRFSGGWGVIVGGWLGSCITSFYSINLSLNASNVRGNTKKSIVNNLYYVGYSLAAVVAAQWWNYTADPTFTAGIIVDIVLWIIMIAGMLLYRWKCISENKRRERIIASGQADNFDESRDLTDRQDVYHRYSY